MRRAGGARAHGPDGLLRVSDGLGRASRWARAGFVSSSSPDRACSVLYLRRAGHGGPPPAAVVAGAVAPAAAT